MDSRHIALAFAISKVDASARIVEGYATVGVRDRQGDIIPLSTAVAAFTANAETLGIREMHQPKAVGRLEGWWKDENADAVYVRVWLSESRDGEDAWLKVQEGILRGFSIGGRAKASHREGDAVVVVDHHCGAGPVGRAFEMAARVGFLKYLGDRFTGRYLDPLLVLLAGVYAGYALAALMHPQADALVELLGVHHVDARYLPKAVQEAGEAHGATRMMATTSRVAVAML